MYLDGTFAGWRIRGGLGMEDVVWQVIAGSRINSFILYLLMYLHVH